MYVNQQKDEDEHHMHSWQCINPGNETTQSTLQAVTELYCKQRPVQKIIPVKSITNGCKEKKKYDLTPSQRQRNFEIE